DQIENWVQDQTMHLFKPLILLVWDGVRWAIAIVTGIAVMALIYHNGLPKTQSWRRVLPRAALATLLLVSPTMFLWLYVTHYATYNVVYGSLSAAIALLVWMYIISAIVLLGAEVNAQAYPKTSDNGLAKKKV